MKDTKTIETLLEVAEAINFHNRNLAERQKERAHFILFGYSNVSERIDHNIEVIERLLLILEKKYNKLLKQLNDEA